MISAARLIAHKTVNGRYQSKLQMDQFPVLGHQMTVNLFRTNLITIDQLLSHTSIPSIHSSRIAQTLRLHCTVATSRP